jgi:hypothetical protein
MPQLLETKHIGFPRDEPKDERYVYLNTFHKLAKSLGKHRKADETYTIRIPSYSLWRISRFVTRKYPLSTNCSVRVRSRKREIEIVWAIYSIVPTIYSRTNCRIQPYTGHYCKCSLVWTRVANWQASSVRASKMPRIYDSTTTFTDLLEATNQVIEDDILDKIRRARIIAIMSDEGTDVNRHGHICICVRYCDQSRGEPTGAFITLLKLKIAMRNLFSSTSSKRWKVDKFVCYGDPPPSERFSHLEKVD